MVGLQRRRNLLCQMAFDTSYSRNIVYDIDQTISHLETREIGLGWFRYMLDILALIPSSMYLSFRGDVFPVSLGPCRLSSKSFVLIELGIRWH